MIIIYSQLAVDEWAPRLCERDAKKMTNNNKVSLDLSSFMAPLFRSRQCWCVYRNAIKQNNIIKKKMPDTMTICVLLRVWS